MSVTLFSPYQEAQKFKQVKGSSSSSRRETHHPCTQLPKSLFPCIRNLLLIPPSSLNNHDNGRRTTSGVVSFPPLKSSAGVCCSLMENPVIWVSRVCVYYALLKAGLVGSQPTIALPFISTSASDSGGGIPDLGFSKWLHHLQAGSSEEKEATNRRKLVKNWHPTTKGTLKRSYRVPSKPEGRRLLKAIASLLSDDDEFRDATSHKGCQIRRETAHGESVCCNNVRALFDELPTPHLVLEITPFPAGPLSEKDYVKAGKLEKVLRSGTSI